MQNVVKQTFRKLTRAKRQCKLTVKAISSLLSSRLPASINFQCKFFIQRNDALPIVFKKFKHIFIQTEMINHHEKFVYVHSLHAFYSTRISRKRPARNGVHRLISPQPMKLQSSFRFPRANASLTREQALFWVRDWRRGRPRYSC